MTDRSASRFSPRKQPKQARSSELVATILEAAIQVLTHEGAQRFTTARVAAKAGVSVGSLYQYFPNKAAILFRLQSDEWRQTTDMWGAILGDTAKPPLERLRSLVHVFIRSEVDEMAVRVALDDAAPLYLDTPEAERIHAEGDRIFEAFMREALPDATDEVRALAGDLVSTTMTAVGNEYSRLPRTEAEITAYSDAMADMLCTYLRRLRDM